MGVCYVAAKNHDNGFKLDGVKHVGSFGAIPGDDEIWNSVERTHDALRAIEKKKNPEE